MVVPFRIAEEYKYEYRCTEYEYDVADEHAF
jgi:hypothetical protein